MQSSDSNSLVGPRRKKTYLWEKLWFFALKNLQQMFLQIIYLWLSQHNVGIYPTYNENISIEASTSMNEPFRCVNMVFIDVCRHAVGMHAVSSSRYEWVFVVARVDLFQFSSIIIFHTCGTPVWPNDEIKSWLFFTILPKK